MTRMLVLLLLSSALFRPPLHAGSQGVKNGTIRGRVFEGNGSPLGGATVVAHRQSPPQIIRSTVSRGDGSYEIFGMPVGEYVIGYAKVGFKTRSTVSGDANEQTALGAQVRVFVEPGGNAMAPPVNLQADPGSGTAHVTVNVLDAYTGEPVQGASVIVGPASSRGGGQPGVYALELPVAYDEASNAYASQPVQISADGYEAFTGALTAVPDAELSQSFSLTPVMAVMQGNLRFDSGLSSDQLGNVQILVDGLPVEAVRGRVSPNGSYSLRLPVSTRFQTRSFDIHFVTAGSTVATRSGVISPRGGTAQIGGAVDLQAKTVTVTGSVLLVNGRPAGSHHADSVVVVEIGRAGTLSNGSYVIDGVPVGRALTLRATAVDPDTGEVGTGEASFTATGDGTGTGSFALPPILVGVGR